MKINTCKKTIAEPIYLESGRILESYELVYESYGKLNSDKSNAILVCHTLTASHHAAGYYKSDRKPGWWDKLIGDGKAIDTNKFFVICINVLGSCFGSTGAMSINHSNNKAYRLTFPVVTIKDMIKTQKRLLEKLGIYRLKVIIGGSMGGMQALCYAVIYPEFSQKIISIAATYATQPWCIAFNKISREAIIKDPLFEDGNYDPHNIKIQKMVGLALARMCGVISYLNPNSMAKKFSRSYVEKEGLYDLKGRFQIESYLDYNGYNFTKYFDPTTYLYLTKAIDIFDLTKNYGSLEDTLKCVTSNLVLISFKGDILFMSKEMRFIKDAMLNIGKGNLVNYIDIDSSYGHDAFLVEVDKFDFLIRKEIEALK